MLFYSTRLFLFTFILLMLTGVGFSQQAKVTIHANAGKDTISRNIYGHFSEHLGHGIYGGIWVGENSKIPNTNGVRNDVIGALKHIKIPNVRWPGGCFADEYHWMDGIGPKDKRPSMVNTNWGGVTEDNSFGTHEFLNFCEEIGAEPYISGNLGSGTVEELSDWVQYVTSESGTPMAELRKQNGREKPWKVKFWGVGNESWGCGGIMTPEFYNDQLRKYSHFMKNYGSNILYKVASGGTEADYDWTEETLSRWSKTDGWLSGYMQGYSLHYYTVSNTWDKKGSAINFNEQEWFNNISKTQRMDTLITKHSAIMDKYDPQNRIGLIVDEWGDWFDVEPGTNPGFLFQQNTMRDAIVAALNFNIFHKHCKRVKMANIAQLVNVLQSLILTDEDKMVLTPTYFVFDMYKVHQDAVSLPLEVSSPVYQVNGQKVDAVSATASKDAAGAVHISLVNVDPDKPISVPCTLDGLKPSKITGQILTSDKMQDYNSFDNPSKIGVKEFTGFKLSGSTIQVDMPAKSIVVLEVK